MIHLVGDRAAPDTTEIVASALVRSFTRGQVRRVDDVAALPSDRGTVVVVVSPDDSVADALQRLARGGAKVVLTGALGPRLAELAGIEAFAVPAALDDAATCAPAPVHGQSESRAALVYANDGLGAASPLRCRRFLRFDFADEWNNLGYGRIGVGAGPWSIATLARGAATTVAAVVIDGAAVGAAVTLCDRPQSAVLWFARPVAAVDGQDWAVVEAFISAHRAGELPCRPFLRGVPHGVAAAVTMRLDCDEDIASARPLFELYAARRRPLSLAVMTGQPEAPEHLALIADVRAAGGAVLSHSATHAVNWGGSAEAAEHEARLSKHWLESRVSGLTVRNAVSPFHQTPRYVPAALARAGLSGLACGSIAWDPEFLMARAGVPPFAPDSMVAHTQGCMLHGDCVPADGDPLAVYAEAFRLAVASGEVFGYLDHPFSARYCYGWRDEESRLGMHARLLDHFDAQAGDGLLFIDEDTCFDFISGRAAVAIEYAEESGSYAVSASHAAGLPLSIGYRSAVVSVRRD